jgi:hypothetical protein
VAHVFVLDVHDVSTPSNGAAYELPGDKVCTIMKSDLGAPHTPPPVSKSSPTVVEALAAEEQAPSAARAAARAARVRMAVRLALCDPVQGLKVRLPIQRDLTGTAVRRNQRQPGRFPTMKFLKG